MLCCLYNQSTDFWNWALNGLHILVQLLNKVVRDKFHAICVLLCQVSFCLASASLISFRFARLCFVRFPFTLLLQVSIWFASQIALSHQIRHGICQARHGPTCRSYRVQSQQSVPEKICPTQDFSAQNTLGEEDPVIESGEEQIVEQSIALWQVTSIWLVQPAIWPEPADQQSILLNQHSWSGYITHSLLKLSFNLSFFSIFLHFM